MADQNSQFMAILTAVGEARLANAQALGIAWNITQLGVGDGNGAEPMPDRLQTELINERRRAPLNQLKVDPSNASIIIAEQVIPEDVGGWWIREIGLYDEAGDLVAVANCPPTFKPQLAQGSGRTQVVRLNLLVSSTQSITLKIDPSVVLATRAYCDSKVAEELAKLDHKQSVRVATTANLAALSGLLTLDGIVLAAGDRVLVKNQTTAKDNGIYIAAAGAWVRADDANLSTEVTSGLVVHVERGTTQADTRWQLVTDGTIVLGTTALTFQNITQGFAPLASPVLTGNPVAPTPPQFDSDTSLATTEFVQRALGNIRGLGPNITTSANLVLTASDVGLLVQAGGADTVQTIRLPEASSCPAGSSIKVRVAKAGGSLQITVPSGLIATPWNKAAVTSFAAETSDTYEFIASPSNNTWLGMSRGGGFFSSLSSPGYQKLPSGFILQMGTVTASVGGTLVTLPITFPNACLFAGAFDIVTPGTSLAAANLDGMAAVSGRGTTSITVHATGAADWLALGW